MRASLFAVCVTFLLASRLACAAPSENLAPCLNNRGEAAIKICGAYIATHPFDVGDKSLGIAYRQRGIAYVTTPPPYPPGVVVYLQSELYQQQYELGISDLDTALGIDPDDRTALRWRATAYRLTGEYDEARADELSISRLSTGSAVSTPSNNASLIRAFIYGVPLALLAFAALASLCFRLDRARAMRLFFTSIIAAIGVGLQAYWTAFPDHPRTPLEAAEWTQHPLASIAGAMTPVLILAPVFYWYLGRAKWFRRTLSRQDGGR